MIKSASRLRVAVVVASKNRPATLSERALSSIAAQTRLPDYLVVVDDSNPDIRPENRDIVASVKLPGSRVTYLENARTQGASGSWNTAIDFLFRKAAPPESLFIAILDDDDSWAPSYLQKCMSMALDQELDMVASDLHRIESIDGDPQINQAPTVMRTADYLTGNPGIQGSNLFLRLSVLLAAGGFDEELPSTTDRDLCIRIADLDCVRYGRLPTPLVNHFAESGRARLSTRGSDAKINGLTGFFRKYAGRMTPTQRQAFHERAASLFDWNPVPDWCAKLTDATVKNAVVLGLIADNERPDALLDIVHDLAACGNTNLKGLYVVLVEDGERRDGRFPVDAAIQELRDAGIGCFHFPIERQADDARAGIFGKDFSSTPGPVSSTHKRKILEIYACHIAQSRTGTEVWLMGNYQSAGNGHDDRMGNKLHHLFAVPIDCKDSPALDVAHGTHAVKALERWIEQERVATAEHRIKQRFSLGNLRLLGFGSEAVVFTDERFVYKCIDYWKTRMPRSQLDFLRKQVGHWIDAPGLYPLHEVVTDGPWIVLTYDYEPSVAYQGGHEKDLIRLLTTCASVGVVCNNIHPKNLVVTASGVKLIDYGSDIRPWSPVGFEHMARRSFLACRHAGHPDLQSLMRRALTDPDLPELTDYPRFRARVDGYTGVLSTHMKSIPGAGFELPEHKPFPLYVGVISSDPIMLGPLLDGLSSLSLNQSIQRLSVVVLDNGCPSARMGAVIDDARRAGLDVAVIPELQQRRDAATGAFGESFRTRPDGQVGIAQARTMLQRYLGALLRADQTSFGWILDDDMRVDKRAHAYLPWLPAFRDQGVDALIGHYEWSSPNPPLNGIRVHLVDLLHNLIWLQGLDACAPLPDRSSENEALRAKYPDYYYDLSRKHTGHLEMPHWLEPAFTGETVGEAYSRLITRSPGILAGDPLTRPVVASMPDDPINSAKESVNRGGCTFVLNHRPLTLTPNIIMRVRGKEARRSDMVWAIVNRYYRGMNIKAVEFPIHHLGRVTPLPTLDLTKVQGEIIGSTFYAGLTEFLRNKPDHELDFSAQETERICDLAEEQMTRRLYALEQSFYRIRGLRSAFHSYSRSDELQNLISYLDRWFTPEIFAEIRSGVHALTRTDVSSFLSSLRNTADTYAAEDVSIRFIWKQLRQTQATFF